MTQRSTLVIKRLKGLTLGLILGLTHASAQDASLFRQVEDDRTSTMLREDLRKETAGVVLELADSVLQAVRQQNLDSWVVKLPCPPDFQAELGLATWELELTRFFPHPSEITLGLSIESGYEERTYAPQLQSFRVHMHGKAVGSLSLMTDHVVGSFHQGGRQFDILHKSGNRYLLADMSQIRDHVPFQCGVVDSKTAPSPSERSRHEASSRAVGGCVEIAIDLDFATWSTFNNVDNATEWALAMMAGVEAIYTQELDGLALLQVSYVHIWQTGDPMNSFVQDAGAMLDSFRSTWLNNNSLNSIQRDVTHLLTKRTNTGTGGIAYLDVNCSSYAYGFSANLTNTSNYNINGYSWNLDVVSHELGHNFGANHTHWCGWPGGAIDDCASAEGGCQDGPSVGTGTIMSYCHTTSTGKTLEFHPLVKTYALVPGFESGSCYTLCEEYVPPECAITNVSAGVQTSCNPITSEYSQQIVLTVDNPPVSGFLNVNGINYANFAQGTQAVLLVDEPADGQSMGVDIYFTAEPTCAATEQNVYVRRDPCCGNFRLNKVDPTAHVLVLENVLECPGEIEGWGILSASADYQTLTSFLAIENPTVDAGDVLTIEYPELESSDWVMLFSPNGDVNDYVQWGPEPPLDAFIMAYGELDTLWPGGFGVFIPDEPPYIYQGNGEHGVSQWTGSSSECAPDVNGNGAVDVADVLLVLSDFGCNNDCNSATDIDGDGGITVGDVLLLLSSFGQDC